MIGAFVQTLAGAVHQTAVTSPHRSGWSVDDALRNIVGNFQKAHAAGQKVVLIGNGGSGAIAGHAAIDFSKNAGVRAMVFSNSAALTCLANDFGYEHVFAKQVEYHGRAGDILIAISSSGKSANILNAVKAARGVGMTVVTFSGFDSGNPLRILGDINFYVPSSEYGFVELAHAILLHAVTDALTVGRTKPEAA